MPEDGGEGGVCVCWGGGGGGGARGETPPHCYVFPDTRTYYRVCVCVGGGGGGGEGRDAATLLCISGHAYILCLMRSVYKVAVLGSRP